MTSPTPSPAAPTSSSDDVGAVADAAATAARSVPGVADLSGGAFSHLATYLPGREVSGVQVRDEVVTVGVVVHWSGLDGPTPRDVAQAVRAAVLPVVEGRAVDVTVEDVDLGEAGEAPEGDAEDGSGSAPAVGAGGGPGPASS